MSYLVELHRPTLPPSYVIAEAATRDAARALVDAHLGRDEANEGVVIGDVYPIQ
jgi:hypothetical protein